MIRGIISPTQDGVGSTCDAAGDFRQMGIHRCGADDGQDQPRRNAAGRADGAEQVSPRPPPVREIRRTPIDSGYRGARGVWCRAGPRCGSGCPAGQRARSPGKPSPRRFSGPAHSWNHSSSALP